jgi:hypothetical protein
MATGSIEDFVSSFLDVDVARPSRFDVVIYFPSGVSNSGPSGVKNLNLRCEAAELPGRTIETHVQKTYGPTEKFPYQNSYNDVTLTFIVDEDMFQRQFFDNWLNFISSTNDFNFKYKTDYAANIKIFQYDGAGDPSYGVSLIDAYPISVNQLDLDWSADGHHKLAVVFAYTYWEPIIDLAGANPSSDGDSAGINDRTASGAKANSLTIELPELPFNYTEF